MHRLIQNNISGKKVLSFFIITQVFYGILMFITIPKLMEYSQKVKILDIMPMGYNLEHVQNLFANLGDVGRNFYLTVQIPIDFIYPLLFTISYSLLLAYLFKKSSLTSSKIKTLNVVPVFAGLFDYLENLGIIGMLKTYPDLNIMLVSTTSTITIAKSIFTTVAFILLISYIINIIYIKLNRKNNDK